MSAVQDGAAETGRKAGSARPAWLEIDLSAVEQNARQVKQYIGAAELMAVVKADGYGLGAPRIAEAALRGGATRLGVACVDEGVQLRQSGITEPILVMGSISPAEAEDAVAYGLSVVVARPETVRALEDAAAGLNRPFTSVPVHLKVDTGLHRYGCDPRDALPLADFIWRSPHLFADGLMTHFASADSVDLSFAHEQLSRFNEVQEKLAQAGFTFGVVHAANSAATLALPEAQFGMVRVGIMLSGHYPRAALLGTLPLFPAVSLKVRIARLMRLEPGDTVGYGQTWTATRHGWGALLPVGYADGFQRSFSNRGVVIAGGALCPVIGRVSMDQAVIDVSDASGLAEGDEAVLLGSRDGLTVSADDWAAWDDTISYEILCGFGKRLPRRYFRNGSELASCDLLGCSASSDITGGTSDAGR